MPYGIDCNQATDEIYRRLADAPLTFDQYDVFNPAAEDLLSRASTLLSIQQLSVLTLVFQMLEKDPRKRATISELKTHPFFSGM